MLLFNDYNEQYMPFPRKWFEEVLADKTGKIRGYLKIKAFDHRFKKPKQVYEFGGENQIMYWLKHAYSFLESGVYFSTNGEHKGYEDGTSTQLSEGDMPSGWSYLNVNGDYIYSTQVWDSNNQTLVTGSNLALNSKLYPFFVTKMRFGEDAPADISTPIDPSEVSLNDIDAQGAGNTAGKLNFIIISRIQHIAFTTTGADPNTPSGYYADYGSVFKNITVYQATMPASVVNYDYDGKSLSEAGLFNDASLTGTTSGLYEQPNGMLLAKRYFSTIQKTNTISINFEWSIIK